MAVTPTTYAPLVYNGNGATTAFAVTFPYYEITVTHIDSSGTETEWTENTHYTTGVNDGEGGTGTVTVETSPTDYTPASGEQLRIERTTTRNQGTTFDLDNEVFEAALQQVTDRAIMIVQEEIYHATRSARLSLQDMATYGALTFPSPVAGKAIGWNSTPDGLTNVDVKDIYVQASEPSGTIVESSLWIDSDSTDYDVYQYTSGSWVDTTMNLKGATGATGATGPVDTSGTPVANDFARFTDSETIEGRSYAEVRSDLGLEIGTDVLAQQTIGIADNNLLEVDGDPNSGEVAVYTANGLAGQTEAEFKSAFNLEAGTDYEAVDADILRADTADVLTAGFAQTPYNAGTKSSGTYTPDEADGNLQYAVNGGAHTLAPPSNNGTIIIQYTNNASAGAITVSGFTATSGDSFDTTNGNDFLAYITKHNGFSHLHIQALQ